MSSSDDRYQHDIFASFQSIQESRTSLGVLHSHVEGERGLSAYLDPARGVHAAVCCAVTKRKIAGRCTGYMALQLINMVRSVTTR